MLLAESEGVWGNTSGVWGLSHWHILDIDYILHHPHQFSVDVRAHTTLPLNII